jgi:hypothetical protein
MMRLLLMCVLVVVLVACGKEENSSQPPQKGVLTILSDMGIETKYYGSSFACDILATGNGLSKSLTIKFVQGTGEGNHICWPANETIKMPCDENNFTCETVDPVIVDSLEKFKAEIHKDGKAITLTGYKRDGGTFKQMKTVTFKRF